MFPGSCKAHLLGLEATVVKIQRATVLSDCSHDLLRRTVRNAGLYLQSQSNVRSQQTRKVSNHFIRYLACVPTDSRGVQLYRPVVTPGRRSWSSFTRFLCRSLTYFPWLARSQYAGGSGLFSGNRLPELPQRSFASAPLRDEPEGRGRYR